MKTAYFMLRFVLCLHFLKRVSITRFKKRAFTRIRKRHSQHFILPRRCLFAIFVNGSFKFTKTSQVIRNGSQSSKRVEFIIQVHKFKNRNKSFCSFDVCVILTFGLYSRIRSRKRRKNERSQRFDKVWESLLSS